MPTPVYTADKIASIVEGRLLCNDSAQAIEHLLTDSRKVTQAESSLFFAIKTERNDGHKYIPDLYEAGVRNFIISFDFSFPLQLSGCSVIAVQNPLLALQKLASWHRRQFNMVVAGISGSNGKTIVKEWLYQLLKDDFNVVRSPKSYNSQTGVPLSVWQMKQEHNLALFEAGISRAGEMQALQEIIQPNIGIFTTLGSAHDEGFSSRGQKLEEKFKLFSNCDVLIYCKDEEAVVAKAAEYVQRNPLLKGISWSMQGQATVQVKQVLVQGKSSRITFSYRSTEFSYSIPFTDLASVHNSLSCVCFLLAVERLSPDMLLRFKQLQSVEMRLQLRDGVHNCTIVNDTYNSDIHSLKIALDFLNQQTQHHKKTIILSDILESGTSKDDLYRQVAAMVEKAGITRIIGIGRDICQQFQKFNISKKFFYSTRHFLENFNSLEFADEIILIKGARIYEFERISRLLENKIHSTMLEINLNALINNLNVFKQELKPGTKVMAMVKALSYGSGSHEIAKALEFHRVDYLAVAYADEGIVLKKAGIKTPVMVMNPEPGSFLGVVQYNLEPEVYNFFILQQLLEQVEGAEINIHLEVDTGMRRLGFAETEIDDLLRLLARYPNVHVRSVFSHLAASDESEHDAFTLEQIGRFEQISSKVCQAFHYPVLKHILNSAGISRFPQAQFDMVRLGIGLYGIDPGHRFQQQLQAVGSLKTIVSQIRHLPAMESIGYSRKGVLKYDSSIAVVAIGYADGLDRRLSNGNGYMLLNGKKAPIVGNICMDMTMLDVTGIDCREGDEVIVFGQSPTIEELGAACNTIPYEILTGISQRVKRVYYQE